MNALKDKAVVYLIHILTDHNNANNRPQFPVENMIDETFLRIVLMLSTSPDGHQIHRTFIYMAYTQYNIDKRKENTDPMYAGARYGNVKAGLLNP